MTARRPIVAAVSTWAVGVVVLVATGATALGDDGFEGEGRAYRGVAGTISVESATRLRAREGIGRTPEGLVPISVRVEFDPATGVHDIEFVGAMAGTFDLRDVLERVDGGPMSEIEPIPVLVVSRLPEFHGSDLFESNPGVLADTGTSLPWTWIAIAAWMIWPVIAVVAWLTRRQPKAEFAAADARKPTLDEEIAALLDRAADESIGTDVRARLELLVFRRLATLIDDRAGSTETDDQECAPERGPERIAETVRELRRHPETRELVRAIESWLHSRDGGARRGDALAMLREFRRRQASATSAADSPRSSDPPDALAPREVQA